jgi:hypothetical protein
VDTERKSKFVAKVLWAIGLATIACSAIPFLSYSDEPTAPSWYKADDVRWWVQHLVVFHGATANSSTSTSENSEESVAPSKACVAAYNHLYPSDKTDLNFSIFIGYWDTQPEPGAPRGNAVIDPYVRNMFSEILTQPCGRGINLCGFTHDPAAGDTGETQHLMKTIAGPDGKSRNIHLTLESTSVSESNRDNEHEYGSEQKAQSAKIQSDFMNSLSTNDVVLYTGHSRWGTGAGFKPLPKLSWSYFDAGFLKPVLHLEEKTLSESSKRPIVLGVFSCTSEKYYSKPFEKDAPDSSLVLTTEAPSDMEAHEATLGTLNALLGLQCEDGFKSSLPDAEILNFFNS